MNINILIVIYVILHCVYINKCILKYKPGLITKEFHKYIMETFMILYY